MADSVRFFVEGDPRPAGSKHAFVVQKQGERPRAIITDAHGAPAKAWRTDVRDAARTAMAGGTPLDGPVAVHICFYMRRPASHYGSGRNANVLKESAPRWRTSAPDVDKLSRAVLDSLKGVAWVDDSQVVSKYVMKPYADRHLGEMTGAEVFIRPIENKSDPLPSTHLRLAV